MTEKVTLPSEIVRLLDENKGDAILYDVEAMARSGYGSLVRIYEFYQKDPRKYFSALVNGYQVEPNPEQKVREYYEEAGKHIACSSCYKSEYHAIRKTIDLLGIKIEGVNA